MENPSDLNHFRVGGSVRDGVLGREPNDIDIVVVGHSVEDMKNAGFEQVVGEAFPVFLHPETKDEWALARLERSTGGGHTDFNIQAAPDVTLEEDLERRDLTINAMAKDPNTGDIIDPFGGLDDIENQTLRHVSEAFAEDPLRVLRVATFAARLPEFTVHPDTKELCKSLEGDLTELSPQRVHREMLKAFRKAHEPRRFFDVLHEIGVLETLFPELHALTEVPAGPEFAHKEGSSFEHTMMVLEEAHNIRPNDERLLLAALAHDLGKGVTDEDDLPNHPGHTKTGLNVVDEMTERLKMTNEHQKVMRDAVRHHMKMHSFDEMNESTIIRFVDAQETAGDKMEMGELIDLAVADSLGRVPSTEPDTDLIREKVDLARNAIDKVNGNFVMDKFDVDQSEGLKIRDLIIQERTLKFRESQS